MVDCRQLYSSSAAESLTQEMKFPGQETATVHLDADFEDDALMNLPAGVHRRLIDGSEAGSWQMDTFM